MYMQRKKIKVIETPTEQILTTKTTIIELTMYVL